MKLLFQQKKTKQDRLAQINKMLEPARHAKEESIHSIAELGRGKKWLRIPLIIFFFVFLFLYNLLLYAFTAIKLEEQLSKAMAVMLTIILIVTSVDLTVFAATYEGDGFTQTVTVDGIAVTVSADAGVFPSDATLSVTRILDGGTTAAIENLVSNDMDSETPVNVETVVEETYTFDVTVYDAEGNEIEPDTSAGQVSLSFQNAEVVNAADASHELSVYYVNDDLSSVEEMESAVSNDVVSIDAEHFSIYSVVITSGAASDTILPYYQGTSLANSYFTIYTSEQLLAYKRLLDLKMAGSVTGSDSVATILVNSDDANPIDGITDLGQSTTLTVANLNFNVKIMDDIRVSNAWTAMTEIPSGVVFDGNGHTIVFANLQTSVSSWTDASALECLATTRTGTISNITVSNGTNSYQVVPSGEVSSNMDDYATVTVRVDGEKAEIGTAIMGAEALAISCDGENFIALQRGDDYSLYYTAISNLEEGKTYAVYYAYEDNNEALQAAEITSTNQHAELDYVSVTYNLSGANTYDEDMNQDIMSAVRVSILQNQTYAAKEDYDAFVVAVDGFELPQIASNVIIKVNGVALTVGTDTSASCYYIYDSTTEHGRIHIDKDQITGPISVEVHADSIEDYDSATITLITKGGTVTNPLWDKSAVQEYAYVQTIYGPTSLPTADEVIPYNGGDSVQFEGWYTNQACTGEKVTSVSNFTNGQNLTFYAKYTIKTVTANNGEMWFSYGRGNMDIRGFNGSGTIKTTYSDAGFSVYYSSGALAAAGGSSNYGGTRLSIPSSQGSDIFVSAGNNIYVAQIYNFDKNYITVTYLIENRGDTAYSNFNLGIGADVQIVNDDQATIAVDPAGQYLTMTTHDASPTIFKLYISGSEFGVTPVSRYWYGGYSGGNNYNGNGWGSNVFNGGGADPKYSSSIDSALAFSWSIDSIPANSVVIRSVKLGIGTANSMNGLTGTFFAGAGTFSNGSEKLSLSSASSNIEILSDGRIRVDGSTTYDVPTRAGYVFGYWSTTDGEYTDDPQPAAMTGSLNGDTKLYAIWIPKPDRSVTNDCSVQKVDGSDNLLVPEQIANIVIENTTAGATVSQIEQGTTVNEAAGYASGFSAILRMQGSDSRYLLPDNITVTIINPDTGQETVLTRDTGYTYHVWNNRRCATLDIRKQYINGNVKISCVGYELPPVTATSVDATATSATVDFGARMSFTADAVTSKNHVVTYQWYIAPYYEITLDNVTYWTYQNQNGEPLTNGTYTGTAWAECGGSSITVSGANRATLRINGVDVSAFGSATNSEGLHKNGYHVYCVVTSTRNITGQQVQAVSDTVETEVVIAQYAAPAGLEGSSPTYYGGSDGSIYLSSVISDATLLYKKTTDSNWQTVTSAQIAAGVIENVRAGDYQFKYQADTNHSESAVSTVTVNEGAYIVITFVAPGCDNTSLRTQYLHVAYGTNVTAQTTSLVTSDGTLTSPARSGYNFVEWDGLPLNNVTENTTVTATYTGAVYKLTLNNGEATSAGTAALYEHYSDGYYLENACTNEICGNTGITVPAKTNCDFLGYYTQATGGTQIIGADGCLTENATFTTFTSNTTLYAHWSRKPISFRSNAQVPVVFTPSEGVPIVSAGTVSADETYSVTITNETGVVKNSINIYMNGVLKQTLSNVVFNENNQYTFDLTPGDYGSGMLTFTLGDATCYTITYKDVNGTRTGTDFTGTFTTTQIIQGISGTATTLPSVTKTGYTFAGWYTAARGTGSAITEIPASNSENIIVYAKWIANQYQITLMTNQGSYTVGYSVPSLYVHNGDDILLPTAMNISREHCEFLGWYENEACTGASVTSVNAQLTGDVTYYAGWSQLPQYTITLTGDGHEGAVYTLSSAEGYSTSVYKGNDYKFTLSMASAYNATAVRVNGRLVTPQNGVYTISNVTADMTVTVAYETIATTSDPGNSAVATILLADGTTGYFDTLEAAVYYARTYGTNSVIKLQSDFTTNEIDELTVSAGKAFSIDLNGHVFAIGNILVEYGADLSIISSEAIASGTALVIENNGACTIGAGVTAAEIQNIGKLTNNGTVTLLTQEQSEDYDVAVTINNGTMGTADLHSGYFVENVLSSAPAGLTGYTTIMNGNEYYVAFADAVTIANASDSDATILMLSTVDNLNQTIIIGNENGKKITVDMNGKNISSGTLKITETTELINGVGNPGRISEVTSTVIAQDDLSVGAYVKLSKTVQDEATISVAENGTISGTVEIASTGTLSNSGSVTGIITNNGGQINNNATMNNVVQNSGSFENHGQVTTNVLLTGGKYTPYTGATPQLPSGVVAKTDTNPVTYYATIKDAFDDFTENAPESITLVLMEDVPDLGGTPVVLDASITVTVDLAGHVFGSSLSTQKLQIKQGEVIFKNTDSNVPKQGGVKTEILIDEGGGIEIEEDVIVDGDIENHGTLENEGTIHGTITNDGDIDNGPHGTIDDVDHNGGTIDNEGTIEDLDQTGGTVDNEGTIDTSQSTGGGFTGTPPTNSAGQEAGKVAKIVVGGNTIYFADVDSALEYAANQSSITTVTLIKEITGETISLSGTTSPVILDMNGYSFDATSSLAIGENATLTLTDGNEPSTPNSIVNCPITNDGKLTVKKWVTVKGAVTNHSGGTLVTEGKVDSVITNEGTLENEGTLKKVVQNSGSIVNKAGGTIEIIVQNGGAVTNNGTVGENTITGGSYSGNDPSTPIDGVAKIGNRVYGSLESAIVDANNADEDTTIVLIDDATLPTTPVTVVENVNGKKITIDLNGHKIKGGTLQIGDETNGSGSTEITDSADDNHKGSVESKIDVKKDGKLTIKPGTTAEDVENEGTLTNDGTINKLDETGGSVTNNGTIDESTITGGSYNGNEATTTDYSGAKISVTNGSETHFYTTFAEAMAATTGGETLTLIADIADTDIVITKNNITIDLNGHVIDADSTITIDENVENAKITDSSSDKSGRMNGTITNKGELEIATGTTVKNVNNQAGANLNNKGTISGTLTNVGDTTNSGTIANIVFTDGGFTGTAPVNGFAPSVKIGETYYTSLDSAVNAANHATTDTTIVVSRNITLGSSDVITIQNENGKVVTLDLNGKTVSSGTIRVTNSSELVIGGEDGTLGSDVEIAQGAVLTVKDSAIVSGDIENKGTLNIDSIDSYVSGAIENHGTLNNQGIIAGEVTNDGTLVNDGNIDNNVTNKSNGNVTNNGNINGQLLNQGNGAVTNNGALNEVKMSGGSLSNESTGSIQNLLQLGGTTDNAGYVKKGVLVATGTYTGINAEEGLVYAEASVTARNGQNQLITTYYTSYSEAKTIAQNSTPSSFTVYVDRSVSDSLTIVEGLNYVIPSGVTITVHAGATLVNNGTITVEEGGRLIIEEGASIDNNGTIVLDDSVTLNAPAIDNEGGTITGGTLGSDSVVTGGTVEDVTNKGTLKEVTVTGTIVNTDGTIKDSNIEGTVTNNGTIENSVIEEGGTVTGGTVTDTTNDGTIKDATLDGDITNNGTIENCTIKEDATVTGGTVSDSTNNGTIKDADVEGTTTNNGTIKDSDLDGTTTNNGTIKDSNIDGTVTGGTITDSTIEGTVSDSEISGTTTISESGTIKDSEIEGTITNKGTIDGGTLTNDVENEGGTIQNVIIEEDVTVTGGTVKDSTNNGTIKDSDIDGTVTNNGTIKDSDIDGTVTNNGTIKDSVIEEDATVTGGTISDTTIEGTVSDSKLSGTTTISETGTVKDSEIEGTITNNGTIKDTEIDGSITNKGTIDGGTLTHDVENEGGTLQNVTIGENVTVTGGTIKDSTNNGTLKDATIEGTLTNNGTVSGGTITGTVNGGTISGNVRNSGTIAGATITGNISNAGGSIRNSTIQKGATVIGGAVYNSVNNGTIRGAELHGTNGNNGESGNGNTDTPDESEGYHHDAILNIDDDQPISNGESGPVEVSYGQGTINVELLLDTDDEIANIHAVSVSSLAEIIAAVLTEEELQMVYEGTTVDVRLVVSAQENSTNVEEENAITTYVEDGEFHAVCFFDIVVEKSIGGADYVRVANLNDEILISVDIPEEYQYENALYKMARYHEGTCAMLDDLDEEETTITFSTAQFSTYAILTDYVETVTDDTILTPPVEAPKKHFPWYLIVIAVIILLGAGYVIYRKKKED